MSVELDSLGIRYEVSQSTETVNLGSAETTRDFVDTKFALVTQSKIQASFTREGLSKKLVKLFKKEIEVGDPKFDDIVYVSTDTPEETAAFLKLPDIQTTILSAVANGGSIEIDERQILIRIPETDASDDGALANFVRVVLKA